MRAGRARLGRGRGRGDGLEFSGRSHSQSTCTLLSPPPPLATRPAEVDRERCAVEKVQHPPGLPTSPDVGSPKEIVWPLPCTLPYAAKTILDSETRLSKERSLLRFRLELASERHSLDMSFNARKAKMSGSSFHRKVRFSSSLLAVSIQYTGPTHARHFSDPARDSAQVCVASLKSLLKLLWYPRATQPRLSVPIPVPASACPC